MTPALSIICGRVSLEKQELTPEHLPDRFKIDCSIIHQATGRVALEQIDDETFLKLISSPRLSDVKEAIKLRPNNWWIYNIEGDTPLTFHAWVGKYEIVDFLLEKHKFTQKELMHKSIDGTALKVAQDHAKDNPRADYTRIIELLRKAGATE